MNNQILVNNIKKLCKDRKVSISTLEKDLFMSPGLISRWVKTTPALDRVMEIANYFQVSLDYLVEAANESVYNNTKLKQLLRILYNKSKEDDLEWDIFDPNHTENKKSTKFLFSLGNQNNTDCFYCNYFDGTFIVTIAYKDDDQKISLYVVADANSFPELLCDDDEVLFKLSALLLKRYSKRLNQIKTSNFIDKFINQSNEDNEDNSYNNLTVFQFNNAANE